MGILEDNKRLARDDEFDYPFKKRPWLHQLKVFNLSKDRNVFAYFTSMGTGKTAMCIHCLAWLWDQGKVDAMLLIAPKGVYRNWDSLEIPSHMPDHVKYDVAYHTSYARAHERDAVKRILTPRAVGDKTLKILEINIEALSSKPNVQMCEMFLKMNKGMIVVDESTVIKSPKADRTKVVVKLGGKSRYKRILSGNPIPNGPLDLFTQAQFLDLSLLGFSNYFGFRNRFAVMVPKTVGGGKTFQAVTGYRDVDYLTELMKPWSIVIKKEDCIDLPPKVYVPNAVELSDVQRVAYDKMLTDSVLMLASMGDQVTAPLVITQMMRLQQVCCGFITMDNGEIHDFGRTPKWEALEEFLERANENEDGKAIIWAPFVYNIEKIVEYIEKTYGREKVVHFYGATTGDERESAKVQFQDPKSPVKFWVANPTSGGRGLTLTQGTSVLYFSNDYNLETRDQSEDRCHRIGTTSRVTYYDIPCKDSVEARILRVLSEKKKMTEAVMVSNYIWLLTGRQK